MTYVNVHWQDNSDTRPLRVAAVSATGGGGGMRVAAQLLTARYLRREEALLQREVSLESWRPAYAFNAAFALLLSIISLLTFPIEVC